MTAATAIRDVRPPVVVIRVLNPIMRRVLRTPLGRLVHPFALIEFAGRRSGNRYRVPVGWHTADGTTVVFTPAVWRANFTGGVPATVRHRGHTQQMTGTLVTDPSAVSEALVSLFASGISPRKVGLAVPSGHDITAADVTAVDRAMIRFRPCDEQEAAGRRAARDSRR